MVLEFGASGVGSLHLIICSLVYVYKYIRDIFN